MMGCCGNSDNRVHPIQAEHEFSTEDFAGPLQNRKCQDVICCLIFIAFWLGMGFISYVALTNGQPERLLHGVDSFGNICGQNNEPIENVSLSGRDMASKPYVFIYLSIGIPLDLMSQKKICVWSCPNETVITPRDYAKYELCLYDIDPHTYNIFTISSDACPSPPIQPSVAILNRCVPTGLLDTAQSTIKIQWIQSAMADIETSWREIGYLCLIAVGLSIVIIILLRFIAGIIVWFVIITFVVGSLGGTGYLWYKWYMANQELHNILNEGLITDIDNENVRMMLIYAGAASAFTVILLLVLLVMRKRIALAVALFKEAGKAVTAIPLLVLQPIWTLLGIIIVIGVHGFILLYLITAGEPKSKEDGTVEYVEDELLYYMKYYYIFGIIWGTQFLVACEQCITAGAVAEWFFARDKKNLDFPILKSAGRVIRYHLGSIAFGSLIITIVMAARLVLGYIQTKLKASQNSALRYILRCLQCCFWIFEKVLRYINRNAYIEIAIHGCSFCKAAQKAFTVIVSNALRVSAVTCVSEFVLFLAKVTVTACVVVVGLEFLQENPDLQFYPVPIAVSALLAFIISHIFISVYEMSIDTLFICFCEDCDRNDGITRPYYMSKNLMNFVKNANKVKKAHEARKRATRH